MNTTLDNTLVKPPDSPVIPEQTTGTVITETKKVEQLPRPFWSSMFEDIHINASGLFMFICLSVVIFYPQYKDKMNELVALAATYLFASAKKKPD